MDYVVEEEEIEIDYELQDLQVTDPLLCDEGTKEPLVLTNEACIKKEEEIEEKFEPQDVNATDPLLLDEDGEKNVKLISNAENAKKELDETGNIKIEEPVTNLDRTEDAIEQQETNTGTKEEEDLSRWFPEEYPFANGKPSRVLQIRIVDMYKTNNVAGSVQDLEELDSRNVVPKNEVNEEESDNMRYSDEGRSESFGTRVEYKFTGDDVHEFTSDCKLKSAPFSVKPCYIKLIRLEESNASESKMQKKNMMPVKKCKKIGSKQKDIDSYECNICYKKLSCKTTLKSHVMRHSDKKPTFLCCHYCDKKFPVISQIRLHISAVHLKLKPFLCKICNRGFASQQAFNSHVRVHTKEKPYKCDECSKAFAHSCALKVHKRVHSGERPYRCKECDKSFSQWPHLQVHEVTHKGTKPFVCKICNKAYTQSSPLKIHSRTHTGERPYGCNLCGKSFPELGTLKNHKLTHSKKKLYTCDVCGVGTNIKTALAIHCRVHTGDRPYKCNNCDRRFANVSAANKHQRVVHEGIKRFVCDTCNHKFGTKDHLRRHVDSMHLK